MVDPDEIQLGRDVRILEEVGLDIGATWPAGRASRSQPKSGRKPRHGASDSAACTGPVQALTPMAVTIAAASERPEKKRLRIAARGCASAFSALD
ncbi:MAG: hypothetical protein R3F21_20115 [Myxococcota bacterium]